MSDNDKNFFKGLLRELISLSLYQLILLILGLIFSTSTFILINNFLSTYIGFIRQNKLLFIVIFAIGGAWLFISLFHRFYRNRPTFPVLDLDFRALEREITYEYKNNNHMFYKKRVLLQALKNNLDRYIDKYSWTGKGTIDVKSSIKDYLYKEGIKKNVWQFYEINFQKTIKKGEIIETELFWDLYDKESKAVPFFSCTITEQTNLLILKLILPPKFGVKEVICEISCGIDASYRPFKTKTLPLDRNGTVKWIVKNPKILYYYEMRWIF